MCKPRESPGPDLRHAGGIYLLSELGTFLYSHWRARWGGWREGGLSSPWLGCRYKDKCNSVCSKNKMKPVRITLWSSFLEVEKLNSVCIQTRISPSFLYVVQFDTQYGCIKKDTVFCDVIMSLFLAFSYFTLENEVNQFVRSSLMCTPLYLW